MYAPAVRSRRSQHRPPILLTAYLWVRRRLRRRTTKELGRLAQSSSESRRGRRRTQSRNPTLRLRSALGTPASPPASGHSVRRPFGRHPVLALAVALALCIAVNATATAECLPEAAEGPVTVESCTIEGADYRLLRAEMTVRGSIPAAIALLDDAEACPDWQAMCVEERATPLDRPSQTLRQRVSGKGISRRITVNRAAWWRTADGFVVGDIAGADDLTPEFDGKRVLCLRSRWILAPGEADGTVEVVQETVSDPQPPFGLGSKVVTPRTAATMVETFTNLDARLGDRRYANGPDVGSLPLLEEELSEVGEEFARCQSARR